MDVFNAFAKDDIWTHSKGLGISLAISKAIAEIHQGTIFAQDGEEGGASFTITISKYLTTE
jgi:signal transduction histidine kinase